MIIRDATIFNGAAGATRTYDDPAVLCGPACILCKMSRGVTSVIVGNCGISLSPVHVASRLIPPLDPLGNENWWVLTASAHTLDACPITRRLTPML